MAFLRLAEGVSLRRKNERAGSPATALLGEGDPGVSVRHGGASVSLPPPETRAVGLHVCVCPGCQSQSRSTLQNP